MKRLYIALLIICSTTVLSTIWGRELERQILNTRHSLTFNLRSSTLFAGQSSTGGTATSTVVGGAGAQAAPPPSSPPSGTPGGYERIRL
jgi:hypothetical protein